MSEAKLLGSENVDARIRVGRDGVIQIRAAASRTWETTTLGRLAREHDKDSAVWQQLRKRGFARPSPSGPSGPTVPEDRRAHKQCVLRLRSEDRARLDMLAATWGVTRSEAVLRLLAQVVPSL